MANDVWPLVHTERRALLADIEPLTDEQWATPSLCGGWSVRDVFAHVGSTARMTPPAFFAAMIGSGFRFKAFAAKGVAKERAGTPADQLARFKALVTATAHPPGPLDSWLGETIVHAEDIRRPLGIKHDYDPAGVTRVADFYKRSNLLIGSKSRIAGLKLTATDTDWSTGSGPEVSGPAIALLLAMTGRAAAVDDLTGDGAATLRSRCA